MLSRLAALALYKFTKKGGNQSWEKWLGAGMSKRGRFWRNSVGFF